MEKKKQNMNTRISKVEAAFQQIQKAVDIVRTEQAQYHQDFNESVNKLTNELNALKEIVNKNNEVILKNGNGRIIKMVREEFYQMLYDKVQLRFFASKLGRIFSLILTLLLILNLVINIFFGGHK